MPIYRVATESDLPAICALGEEVNSVHHEAFPNIFAGPGPPERDRSHWGSCVGKTDSTTLVAVEAERIVGFVTVAVGTESNSLLQPLRFARVGSVGVTATRRGCGIGPALMKHAESWARQQGAVELRLNVWAFNTRLAASLASEA